VNVAQNVLVFGVHCYRWLISPAKNLLFGPLGRCRFTPSCSEYALDALRYHGALTGSWLALKRVGRCHPWGGCGHDPVPAAAPDSSLVPDLHPLQYSYGGRVGLRTPRLSGRFHNQRD